MRRAASSPSSSCRAGPWGGLYAILFATLAVQHLLFADIRPRATACRHYDYRSFFKRLLGPGMALVRAFVLALRRPDPRRLRRRGRRDRERRVRRARMGRHGHSGAGIAGVVAFGNTAVERLFRDVSYYLYAIYAVFIVLALWKFGDRVPAVSQPITQTSGWALSGLTYVRLQYRRRSGHPAGAAAPAERSRCGRRRGYRRTADDASGAALLHPDGGLLSGQCRAQRCRRIILLQQIGIPAFHLLFQAMIFSALLESGTSSVHAINERIDHAWQARTGRELTHRARLSIAPVVLVGCMFLAEPLRPRCADRQRLPRARLHPARDLHPAARDRRHLEDCSRNENLPPQPFAIKE